MTEKEYMVHHIKKNCSERTIREMATTLDIKESKVKSICESLNITPINEKGKRVRFITQNASKMSVSQMAKKLDVTETTIYALLREQGIILKKGRPSSGTEGILQNILGDITGQPEEGGNADTEELIMLSKRALANPEQYHDFQLSIAHDVKRKNPDRFQ